MDEDAAIRHRLLTGVAGVRGEPPLKKLAKACVLFGGATGGAERKGAAALSTF